MPADEKYILAIDLGTSGPKVALVSVQGELVGSEFEETQLLLLPEGGAEQSPAEWWQKIDKAVKRLLDKGLASNDEIVAIAITGQWSGTVPVDEDGTALTNAIIWMDARGAPFIKQIVEGRLNVEGYAPGKLVKWLQLTGGIPAHAGKDSIAHILYLKHTQPNIYGRTYKFLEPVDYIGLRLTGQMAATFNSIVLYWLTDNRNIDNIPYDDALIKISTIDSAKLPPSSLPTPSWGRCCRKLPGNGDCGKMSRW
jgi:xylulokinase